MAGHDTGMPATSQPLDPESTGTTACLRVATTRPRLPRTPSNRVLIALPATYIFHGELTNTTAIGA
jgi:hypothetical protein